MFVIDFYNLRIESLMANIKIVYLGTSTKD